MYFNILAETGIGSATVARKYSSINVFFKFLIYIDKIDSSPMEFIDYPKILKKLPEYLTIEEVEIFLNAIETQTHTGKRDRALYEFMYSTGVRVSEVSNAYVENLNLKEEYIKIEGKGKKERIIPFGKVCKKFLILYLKEARPFLNSKNSPYIFYQEEGTI